MVFLFQTSVLWDIKAEVAQRAHYQAAGSRRRRARSMSHPQVNCCAGSYRE